MSRRTLTLDVSLLRGVGSSEFTPATVNYPEDFADFLVLPDKDGGLWSSAAFGPAPRDIIRPRRGVVCPAGEVGRFDECVTSMSCLVLDYDGKHGDPLESNAVDTIRAMWPWDHVIHSTWSHAADAPRLRVILPMTRRVAPAEYARLYAAALARDARIDPACQNPSRFFYWPSKKSLDAASVYEYNYGELLDPDALAGDHDPAHNGDAGSSRPPFRVIQRPSSRAHEGAEGHGGGAANPFAGTSAEADRLEDFARVLTACPFVAHAVADAATLPNPEWRAVLSIASRCEEGEAIAHAVSAPYPGYTPDETQHEYERVAAYGPMTCHKIEELAGSRWCSTCPHRGKITSPIQLGSPPPEPPKPIALRVASLPPEERAAVVEEGIENARARADAAARAEGEAIAKRDAARRRYQLCSKLGTPDQDVSAALTEKLEAEAQAREATAARRRAEVALEKARAASDVVGLPPGADATVWGRLSLISPGGVVKPADTIGNVLRIFNEDPAWSSRLTFDAFALEVCLDGAPLPEGEATNLAAELAYRYTLDTSTPRVKECMFSSAKKRSFHPVRAYLDELRWDGTARIDTMLFEGFGVEAEGEFDDVLRLMSRRFLISMIARAYEPGCQVDTMLVLQGEQGDGKSRCLEALAGAGWFSRTAIDIGDKDAYMQVRGTWLYELAEMHALKRSDAETMKQWASSSVDRFRAPYASSVTAHPRQGVVAWTVNPEQPFTDPTGNRRYWPATCTRVIDPDWITAHRDALFAEAKALYESETHLGRKRTAATRWWFQKGEEEFDRLGTLTEGYTATDPWKYPIYQWLVAEAKRAVKGVPSFTAEDILTRVFQRNSGDATHAELCRIGNILGKKGLGITNERKLLAGSRHTWYYLDSESKTKLGVLTQIGTEGSGGNAVSSQVANPFNAAGAR